MKTTKAGSLAFAFALLAMAAPAFAENDLPADHFSRTVLSKEGHQWHSAGGKGQKMVMGDTATTFQTGDNPVLAQDRPAQFKGRAARDERPSASPATGAAGR